MTSLIPNRFLFDFEFPFRHRSDPPPVNGKLGGWNDAELLPTLGELDDRDDFADVWACWNERGLHFAFRVTGKTKPLSCNPVGSRKGDGVRICTDMRDARSLKRATRTCQQFYLLPTGAGPDKDQPVAGISRINRARDNAPQVETRRIKVASSISKTGYTLEAHIPADCLSGFDPAEHPRIGFYYIIEDRDHGRQYLTVGDDLFANVDPSTWATVVLQRD